MNIIEPELVPQKTVIIDGYTNYIIINTIKYFSVITCIALLITIIFNKIKHRKTNKIIIEGKAEAQLPVFYLDGVRYRARIKLTFEIKNSDTDKNILLGDSNRENEVTYKNKKYTVYIDAPMGTTLLNNSLLLDLEPVIDLMVNDKKASNLNEF